MQYIYLYPNQNCPTCHTPLLNTYNHIYYLKISKCRSPSLFLLYFHTCIFSSCLWGTRRGLNPPHRVKSISMTTFTEQEIESLKNGGNEVSIHLHSCMYKAYFNECLVDHQVYNMKVKISV